MTIASAAQHMHNSTHQAASQPSIHSQVSHAEETPPTAMCDAVKCVQEAQASQDILAGHSDTRNPW